MKPTLKKVSKYENKFAKLQKKAAEFNFRNQLKQVKKKEFTLEEEDKEVRAIVFDLIRNLFIYFFFFLNFRHFFSQSPRRWQSHFSSFIRLWSFVARELSAPSSSSSLFSFFFLLVGRIQGFAMTFALCFPIKYQSCICTRARLQWLKFFRMIFEYFFLFFFVFFFAIRRVGSTQSRFFSSH